MKPAALLTLFLIGLAGPSYAGDEQCGFGCAEVGVIEPPGIYSQRNPLKPIRINHLPVSEVQTVCGRYVPAGGWLDGCAIVGERFCEIYINDALPFSHKYFCMVRHEVAHCSGWPATHPPD